MTKKQYIKRLQQHDKSFSILWGKIVKDTNDYIKDNKHNLGVFNEAEHLTDFICLSGAWIIDRLNNKIGTTHSKTYSRSLTKKIRKALGFTF